MFRALKNTGSSAPLQQSDCFAHNNYWLDYWKTCEYSIDANLLKGKSKEQIKKIVADNCCMQMVCLRRDEWLQKNNLYSCKHTDAAEPTSPHFGAKKEGNNYENEQKLAFAKAKRKYMGI